MSIPRIVNAMEYIDDDLVSGAVTYTRHRKKWWANWKAIAACVAVVAVVFGAITFLNNGPAVLPFVLTAYALESDNTVSAAVMLEGENIPVTMFEADNGVWGFVFSHEAENPTDYVSISIMTVGQQVTIDEQIEAINGIELDNTLNYVFFIPPQDEAGPFSLPLTMEDERTNQIAMLHVVIEQSEGGYVARIDEVTVHERREAP